MDTKIIYDHQEMIGSALELSAESELISADAACMGYIVSDLSGVSSVFLTKISEHAFHIKSVPLDNLRKDVASYGRDIWSASNNMADLDEAIAEQIKGKG